MKPICQTTLPILPWMDPKLHRLPGILPLGDAPWLWRDDAFANQMAYRDQLIATRRAEVFAATDDASEAAEELLDLIKTEIAADEGYQVSPRETRRPDGITISATDHPLITAGRLVQEDLLIMQATNGEHILTAGLLCFPASWTLAQKFGRGLVAIHNPVTPYDEEIARRVQRLFDGIRTQIPVWRANYLLYEDPDLFHPRTENDDRGTIGNRGQWVRVERQTLRRLANTGAIIFGVHTFIVPLDSLEPAARDALLRDKAPTPEGAPT